MAAKRKRRHHSIPRMILRGFTDENEKIWRYDKSMLDEDPIPMSINDASVYKDLYNITTSNIAKEDIFENAFTKVEGCCVKIIENIIETQKLDINNDDREALAFLIALQWIRTPTYMNHLNNFFSAELELIALSSAREKEHWTKNYKKFHPNLPDTEVEKDRQAILNKEFSYHFDKGYLLKILVDLANVFYIHFARMNWTLVKSISSEPFIISDNIANVTNPNIPASNIYKPALIHLDSTVIFPLSQKLLIYMKNEKSQKSNQIKQKKTISKYNKLIYSNAQKYIFSSSKNLKEILKKYNLI